MSGQIRTIEIYTDGATSPNPGPGGYAVILVDNGTRIELSGGFRMTTNNRMELLAVISGLRAAADRGRPIAVYSDSRYVVDMINGGYAQRWRANGWMRDRRQHAENPDLWGDLLDLCAGLDVEFSWIRGHDDHVENERCDELAVAARQLDNLPPDSTYEKAIEIAPRQGEFEWE